MSKKFYQDNKFKFFVFVLICIICWQIGRFLKIDIDKTREFLSQFPLVLSGVIYVFLYVLGTTLVWFGPKDIMRVVGAWLFGPFISTIFCFFGEMGNAFVLFYCSRKLGREFIRQKFNIKDRDIDKDIKRNKGFFSALLFRYNIIFPLRFVDIGAGLSSISFKKYFLAILIATPIRTLVVQWWIYDLGEGIYKYPALLKASVTNMDQFLRIYYEIMGSLDPNLIILCMFYVLSLLLLYFVAFIIKIIKMIIPHAKKV